LHFTAQPLVTIHRTGQNPSGRYMLLWCYTHPDFHGTDRYVDLFPSFMALYFIALKDVCGGCTKMWSWPILGNIAEFSSTNS